MVPFLIGLAIWVFFFLVFLGVILWAMRVIPRRGKSKKAKESIKDILTSKTGVTSRGYRITMDMPRNEYSSLSVEQLRMKKKELEKAYLNEIDYVSLMRMNTNKLQDILDLLEWHYDVENVRPYLQKRKDHQKAIRDFDREMAMIDNSWGKIDY